MTKLLGLGIGFVLIIGLVIKKKPLALAMFAGALVTGLGTGLGVSWLARTWFQALVHRDTLELAAMVGAITLLSYIMAVSKLHERLVNATIRLLRSAKLAVMVIPPLIGAMPIPGGAIVSAPLVDRPADMLGLSQARKAAINLVFRHANFFVLPFSSSLVLGAKLINVDVYYLIPFLAPLAVVVWVIGYWTLVRDAKPVASGAADSLTATETAAAAADLGSGVGMSAGREFMFSASPILLSLFIGFVFRVPFWLAVTCGILWALVITWRTHPWSAAALLRGVDKMLILAMFGIMSFRSIVVNGEVLAQLATMFESSPVPLPVLGFVIAFLISIVSANHNTTLGIAYPMILPLVAPGETMAYAVLMFAGSFIAYFSSPLHLCQILTNEHCKVNLPQAFREYRWVMLGVAATAWGLFFLYLPK